jgi:hypothetical protein
MKSRYLSMVCIALMLLLLAAGGWYTAGEHWRHPFQRPMQPLPPLPEIAVPDPGEMVLMNTLYQQIPQLQSMAATRQEPVDMALFGDAADKAQRQVQTRNAGPDAAVTGAYNPAYSLSYTFTSLSKKFCILDGKLYESGALLPDGSSIRDILPRKVLLAKDDKMKWIEVDRDRFVQETQQPQQMEPRP